MVIFCVDFLLFVPFFRNDRKKNQREKVSEGQFFPTKKEEKVCRKEETNNYAFRREIRGGQTRAQTHFSRSIKRPTTLPFSTRYRDFLRPRAILCFLSSRAALYFTKTADDDDDDDGGERKPCRPVNREHRERIFSSFFSSFLPLCEIFSKIFLGVRDKEREQNSLSLPLLLFSLSSHSRARELSTTTTKKIQKREKSSRERKPIVSFLFPTTTSYISLSSAR